MSKSAKVVLGSAPPPAYGALLFWWTSQAAFNSTG